MPLGTGLASQVVVGQEGTVGTQASSIDHAVEFNSETVDYTKNVLQGEGLHAGGQYNRSARRVVSTVTAAGDVVMDHAYNKRGIFWKNNLGVASSPTTVGTGSVAYKTVFTPGGLQGLGLTYQKGVPQTSDGTVIPLTFIGGKVSGWKFSVADGQIAQLSETFDFWNVVTATALVAPSYAVGNGVFNFSQCAIKVGGTPTTTSGVTTIASGVTATTLFNSFELDGSNPMKVDRYGLGNAGVKREQLENGYRTLTGTLGGEFSNRTEIYDLFKSDTQTSLQITFTGPSIAGSGGQNYSLDIVLPAVFIDTDAVQVGGPDVVGQSPTFSVLDDGTNNVIQVTTVNTDSTV